MAALSNLTDHPDGVDADMARLMRRAWCEVSGVWGVVVWVTACVNGEEISLHARPQ